MIVRRSTNHRHLRMCGTSSVDMFELCLRRGLLERLILPFVRLSVPCGSVDWARCPAQRALGDISVNI